MKIKGKKLMVSGIAIALAGVLGGEALLQTSVSVQASTEMMPGIEKIIEKATTGNESFRILEIVDDKSEAEIGYYISGQEPYVKLYQYTDKSVTSRSFSSLEDGLSKIEDAKIRKEFAENKKYNNDGTLSNDPTGIKDISYATGDNAPLSYSDYQERYFSKPDDSWKKVDFYNFDGSIRTEKVNVQGKYVPNENGTGDYTKQDQTYYPIRDDEDSQNSSQKFRENIQNFFFSEGETANAPYYLEFEEVQNDSVNEKLQTDLGKNLLRQEYDYTQNRYGYYENVYSNLTAELAEDIGTYPGENPTVPTITPILTIDPVVETEKFSEGGESEFTSNEIITQENNSTEVSGDADSFESGADMGSSASAGDEFSDSEQISADVNTDATVTDSSAPAQAATDPPTGTDSESGSGTNSDSGNNKQTLKPTTVGIAPCTAQNPYVYLGTTINTYPYYSYTAITDLTAAKKEAEKNEEKKKAATAANPYVPEVGDITIEDGQYYYWQESGNDIVKSPITIITGKQPVAYSDLHEIDQKNLEYNYYYRVSKVYFCCKKQDGNTSSAVDNYKYYGWYYPYYPQGEDAYLPVQNGQKPTYYISDAEYELTPGKGDYDFVQGTDDGTQQYEVEINHMYYTGGYKNNDWFKRYVFHLDPPEDDKTENDFTKFNIQVTTLTKEEFNTEYVQNDNTNVPAAQDTADENFDDSDAAMSVPEDSTADSSDSESPESPESSEVADGQVSEVENIVSEAGVELVSIENEINDFSDDSESNTTAVNSADNSADTDSAANQEVDTGSITSETDTSENTTTDFQDGTEENTDIFSDNADAFSAGDTDTTADSPLKDYDLIYINSNLSKAQADVIVSYNNSVKQSEQIPCIINSAKATSTATSPSEITEAFRDFYKAEDADGHYVNQYVYFFKNTLNDQEKGNLLSTSFITNFNSNSDSDISDGTNSKTEGFEEILEYIKSENKYRQLGTATGNDFTDDDQQTVTPTPAPKLLTTELSHARAIEYIINYKYKRQILSKSQINVLEIEPAKSDGQISTSDVLNWMGYSYATAKVETCCSHPGQGADNLVDNNPDTIWHSAYGSDRRQHKDNHWIRITYDKPISMNGITYLPRTGSTNGRITDFQIKLYDSANSNSPFYNETQSHAFNGTDGSYQKYTLKQTYNNVEKIEINITGAKSEESGKSFASGAELSVNTVNMQVPEVKIPKMTAAEYVGHIDDINTKYDMIYIGSDNANRTSWLNGDDSNMLYTHVGGLRKASANAKYWKLIGQMDQDFNSDKMVNTSSSTASFRGSGNDITKQQYKELIDFVKSGYPVVLSDGLYKNNDIDTSKVDNSSYWYSFLKKAISYKNVMSISQVKNEKENIDFYLNVGKPQICFSAETADNPGGMPYQAPRGNKSGNITDADNNVISKYAYIDGELKFRFTIKNDSAVSMVNTQYYCKLYLDLNFDGNLSDAEEQSSYIEIRDSDNVVQTKTENSDGEKSYHLQANKEYTLVRKIPSDYYKLIAWKLEILNASNSSIRTSAMGYSKQKKNSDEQKITINVLQIVPENTCSEDAVKNRKTQYGTWDLTEAKGKFQDKIAKLDDFNINVEQETVKQFDEKPNDYLNGNGNNIKEKQMVIIGFDDVYENISQDGVNAILEFIKKGKSVIFSHDTTSLYNYEYGGQLQTGSDGKLTHKAENIQDPHNLVNGEPLWTPWLSNKDKLNWGVSMNQILRNVVGMDRYGITSTESFGSSTVSKLLKQGNTLNSNSVDLKTLMKLAGDVAYVTNSDRTQSYAQTQGYSNSQIERIDDSETVTRATKVNDGAITQYPYIMGDKITIAGTHSQYYQLALEQDNDNDNKNDIVVWYCLSAAEDEKDKYINSPNDVRNYYYFYSKGNVIYTGAGHSLVKNDDEIELFINAIVAAANVAAVQPEVKFIKSLNPVAETESTRYYMTDQSSWTEEDNNLLDPETKLYFNVKDYNMVSASLSAEDKNKKEMTAEIYIENENGSVITPEENEVIPAGVASKKLASLNKKIEQLVPYENNHKPVTIGNDGKFHLDNGTYQFVLSNSDLKSYLQNSDGSYKANCKVYVRIKSTVSLYGKSITNYAWTSIDLKQRQLFDMD